MMNFIKILFCLFVYVFASCDSSKTSSTLVTTDVPEDQTNNEDISDSNTDTDDGNTDEVQYSSVVEEYDQLSVQGSKIVDKNRNPIQLRGMSFFWSQWIGKYYNADVVKWLKDDWQCTVVRAAMAIDHDGYLVNPEIEKEKVFAVVDAAIEEGLYVVIDWHDHEGELHLEEAKAFFAEVAQKYGEYPNIIYEPYNEPLDVSWNEVLKPYHEAVIAEIRKYDSDNLIICGTRNWSQDVDDVIGNKIDATNIAYTLHYYAATHKQQLRDIATVALNNDIPLFVTEFGTTEASGDESIDIEESELWWAFLDENQISWCNWSLADKEELAAALKPNTSTSGAWSLDDLTQSGTMIRAELLKKNKKY